MSLLFSFHAAQGRSLSGNSLVRNISENIEAITMAIIPSAEK